MKKRCAWCAGDPLSTRYHDEEWGVPLHDDDRLFEMLILEGAQAGLSWLTILKRREGYRRAFDRFDARKIARYGAARVARLLLDPGIVRHRSKIEAAIANARACLEVRREFGSLDRYLWSFAPTPTTTRPRRAVSTPASAALSADLRRRGFRFVGPTICHAFMQAVGMVNDHAPGCFLAPRRRKKSRAPAKRQAQPKK